MNDMSVWCYACDAYLDMFKLPSLHAVFSHLYAWKFDGELPSLPAAAPSAATTAPTTTAAGSA